MNDNSTPATNNGWLSNIEGYIRQYCELQQMKNDLSSVLIVNSTEKTATHMAVRLSAEREINGRMDYLSHAITGVVIEHCTQLRDLLNPQNQSIKTNVPDAYADFYYLRDVDLKPKRLGDYPFGLSLEQCRKLYAQGWLFHTRKDALRVREVMRRAYINEVMGLKGADSILFNRPSCP